MPPDVALPAFLAGIMRSLCSEQWRLRGHQETFADQSIPERVYAAAEALTAIDRLFASDIRVLNMIAGCCVMVWRGSGQECFSADAAFAVECDACCEVITVLSDAENESAEPTTPIVSDVANGKLGVRRRYCKLSSTLNPCLAQARQPPV